ncbi:MAG: adenylate kinase [Candidatus Omnitrophica bacterium CG1_02_49_10]|nr:MAG: adenylate kinase [Candidatus Omnitrophica bacterium CG1_02_49_10]
MRLVFLGPPGAGKGTQAQRLREELDIPHISTGDILRQVAEDEEDPLGRKVKDYMKRGELVPDDIVVEIVKKRLSADDAEKGFILDGFPRTEAQARQLDAALQSVDRPIDITINFRTSEPVVMARLSGRRICTSCGANYHVKNMPPKRDGVCDRCGGPVEKRADDNETAIKRRLVLYNEQTAGLEEYYKKNNTLETVSGDLDVEELRGVLLKLFDRSGLIKHK